MNGGKAGVHDQRSTTLEQEFQGLLNDYLSLGIDVSGGLHRESESWGLTGQHGKN